MNDTFLNTTNKHLRILCKGVNEGIVFNECFSQDLTKSYTMLQEVKMYSSMQDPILRYLAIQSYHLFENVQNMKNYDLENIVTKSREYRAILTECEDQIVNEIRIMDNGSNDDELKYNFATTYCNIIRDYQMLWHLAETFFIKSSCGGFLIQDLQGWLNLQQPHVSYNYNQLMDTYNNSNGDIELESENTFWPTVLCLTMQGRKNELLNLLICHTHSNGQAMRAVRSVVELLPMFTEEFVKCPLEFELVWKKWHKLAENNLVDSCLLGPYPELLLLADILLGNKEAFLNRAIIDLVDGSWYYAIVPYLFYSKPLIKVNEVSNCFKEFKRDFQRSVTQFNDVATDVCSEQILQAIDAIFSLDLGEFIGAISRNSNDWWLPAHLVDLIEKVNPQLFPGPKVPVTGHVTLADDACSLKEFLVAKYASTLTSHRTMALMALNYLDKCPTIGPDHIEHIVSGLPLDTDRMATMMHSWCVEHNYGDIGAMICKRQAMAAFRHNKYGNSLAWSVKANDGTFVGRIADRLLGLILTVDVTMDECQWLEMLDCVKNVSMGAVTGKKMTFVVRFREVLRLVAEGKYGEARRCLMKVVQSQLVSSHHNVAILRSVAPLLEARDKDQETETEGGMFTTGDIELLMEMVEEAVPSGLDGPLVRGGGVEVDRLKRRLVDLLSDACLV